MKLFRLRNFTKYLPKRPPPSRPAEPFKLLLLPKSQPFLGVVVDSDLLRRFTTFVSESVPIMFARSWDWND
eukprot:m.755690 g.755690  ORF g.755690 m.755690 type:complete len:71 (+) comp59015_c0_seq5:1553-1765(+)